MKGGDIIKKLITILSILIFITCDKVLAVTIEEEDFIDDIYIKKEAPNKTYYLTAQFVKTSDQKIVYCLEPFKEIITTNYKNEVSLDDYHDLTKEQLEEIKLIIYYGYNYPNRTEDKWYAITQLLIWQTVSPSTPIYFTSKLNGTKTNIYDEEINILKNDIAKHKEKPSVIHDYTVNLNDSLIIEDLSSPYQTSYNETGSFKLDNITSSKEIEVTKILPYNNLDEFIIYDHLNSQDLIKPGRIENPKWTFNINVAKGNIKLNLDYDESSIESEYNVCYELNKKEYCTDSKTSILTEDLPYGTYQIVQTKNGIGYDPIEEIYEVTIDENEEHPEVTITSKLIKNTFYLKKYYCLIEECQPESAALFVINNINNEQITELITNELGESSITLPYGHYEIIQTKGLGGYELVSPFNIFVKDRTTKLKEELFDQIIIEETPPDTGIEIETQSSNIGIVISILIILSKIRR